MRIKNKTVMLFAVITIFAFANADLCFADVYQMQLKLDTSSGELSGSQRIQYLNDSSEPLSELCFRLDINYGFGGPSPDFGFPGLLEILSVADGEGNKLPWKYKILGFSKRESEKGMLAVELPAALEAGQETIVVIEFKLACKQLLTTSTTALQDDPYFSPDAWYPKAMSFKDGAWSINDDRPSDYSVEIEYPKTMKLASTGKKVKEEPTVDGRRKVLLQAENVRGFSVYGADSFKVFKRSSGEMELAVYYVEVNPERIPDLLDAVEDTISFYREKFGPYPTTHLDILCTGTARGGGAYAACNVIGLFANRYFEQNYRWLVAHEVAHQYFGNLVNQPRDEVHWVVVGLGMILDHDYIADRGISSQVAGMMTGSYRMVKEQGRNTTLSQPVSKLLAEPRPWSFQWNLAMGHAKAFSVFKMLEYLIGTDNLRDVIRRIIKEKTLSTITAKDLIGYCEEAGGIKLDWFVSDWIEGDATLDYAVADVQKGEDSWEVKIQQVGTAAFPVPVEAETASGKKLSGKVDPSLQENILKFTSDEEIVSVVIDPGSDFPDLKLEDNRWPKVEEAEKGEAKPRERPKTISDIILEALVYEGEGNVEKAFKKHMNDHAGDWMTFESEMIELGQKLLKQSKLKEAVLVFKLNAETYPDSWKAWNSLADAYMKNGQQEPAIGCFEKALALNPENKHAASMLEQLKEKKPN